MLVFEDVFQSRLAHSIMALLATEGGVARVLHLDNDKRLVLDGALLGGETTHQERFHLVAGV